MTFKIFIDGEHGTTGLQIRARLAGRREFEILSVPQDRRRDEDLRRQRLNEADLAVLCLPDDAARAAVAMITNPATRILDASTAHRVADGWVYGFPELDDGQAARIAEARFVANPGCYATAMIGLVRPLVDRGLIGRDLPLSVHGVQGYSGGGRQLVEAVEEGRGDHPLAGPYRAYALSLWHKHQPEMQVYSSLDQPPLFMPAVGSWRQGQLVSIPLHLEQLPSGARAADLHAALRDHYAGQHFVNVKPFEPGKIQVLEAETLAGTNLMEIFVFEREEDRHAVLLARMDNLGKGASGAACQNIDIMLHGAAGHDYTLAHEAA